MSAKFTIGLTFGVLAVMLLTSVVIIYFTKEGRDQSERNNQDIDKLEKKLDGFVNMWTERVKIGNTNTNNTQNLIVDTQKNILGNLTSHRVVTYETFTHIQELLNATNSLTGPEYERLADQRTNRIIGNLSADHEIIMDALNITRENNNNQTELKQLIENYLSSNNFTN